MSGLNHRLTNGNNNNVIIANLKKGLRDFYLNDGVYQKYLDVMAKFHKYSPLNCALIHKRFPNAEYVATYLRWNELGRRIKRGSHGVKIWAPNDKTGGFHQITVFDISQTVGTPLPEEKMRYLTEDMRGYQILFDAAVSISPFSVMFADKSNFDGTGHRGTCYFDERKILLRKGMGELERFKVCIHEIAHAMMHNPHMAGYVAKDRATRELEAESVAYIVCAHFSLDTSDYSFGYIYHWSCDKGYELLDQSLDRIQKCSSEIIENIKYSLGKSADIYVAAEDDVEDEEPVMNESLIQFLDSNGYEYIDKRSKNGALWIIGGFNIGKILSSQNKGYVFNFKRGGGKCCHGQDAWWVA